MSPKLHSQSAPAHRSLLKVEALEDRNVPAVAGASGFVQGVYQQVLGRAADDIGLKGYVYRLDNGASREEVASEIWKSQEHRSQEVLELYQTFLGRTPKQEEYDSWMGFFRGGGTTEDAIASFATSQEYNDAHLTTRGMVDDYYRLILGRTPATGEIDKYVTALTKGQIEKRGVVDGMIEGAEFRADSVDSLYAQLLNRSSDKTGHDGYADALAGRTNIDDVAANLLASDEFFAAHKSV